MLFSLSRYPSETSENLFLLLHERQRREEVHRENWKLQENFMGYIGDVHTGQSPSSQSIYLFKDISIVRDHELTAKDGER